MLARILHSNAGSSVAFLHAHMAMRPAAKQGHAQLLEEQGYAQLSPYAVEICNGRLSRSLVHGVPAQTLMPAMTSWTTSLSRCSGPRRDSNIDFRDESSSFEAIFGFVEQTTITSTTTTATTTTTTTCRR